LSRYRSNYRALRAQTFPLALLNCRLPQEPKIPFTLRTAFPRFASMNNSLSHMQIFPSLHHKLSFSPSIPPSRANSLRKGGNAWTSQVSDFQQYLIIDLGQTKNITRISIQGRPHHSEYVSEFSISYGYNGLDYADYKEPGGNTKVIGGKGKLTTPGKAS
jgi:hypothetical protein